MKVQLVRRIPMMSSEHDRARLNGWRAYVEDVPVLRKVIEVTFLDFVLIRTLVGQRQARTEALYRVKADKRCAYMWVLARFLREPTITFEAVDNWLEAENEVLG